MKPLSVAVSRQLGKKSGFRRREGILHKGFGTSLQATPGYSVALFVCLSLFLLLCACIGLHMCFCSAVRGSVPFLPPLPPALSLQRLHVYVYARTYAIACDCHECVCTRNASNYGTYAIYSLPSERLRGASLPCCFVSTRHGVGRALEQQDRTSALR